MLSRLKAGIARTRENLFGGIGQLLGRTTAVDQSTIDDLETLLLTSDVGVAATARLLAGLRKIPTGETPASVLKQEMLAILAPCEAQLDLKALAPKPFVMLVVGVNGVGKTTTIAKIARFATGAGQSVLLAAGDTFRAAAVEQLRSWAERLEVPIVAQGTGADPASVIFDACAAAQSRDIDLLIADTAGRLHTQDNLMAELAKVKRVIGKYDESAPHEVLLVLDATMGQNAINQAEQFVNAVDVTGLVLTKLDGTARGGVIFALAERFGCPIRYIGVGEGPDDLQPFDAAGFVDALLETDNETAYET